jgi:hypothetical protein
VNALAKLTLPRKNFRARSLVSSILLREVSLYEALKSTSSTLYSKLDRALVIAMSKFGNG